MIGVDAIEFDDVDGYQNHTGLGFGAATQLPYNASLANLAHRVGFTVGLKNDVDQSVALRPYFDFAIYEECWQFSECGPLQAWPSRYGKAVFNVEYEARPAAFCPQAIRRHTTSTRSRRRTTCPICRTAPAAEHSGSSGRMPRTPLWV